MSFVQLGDVTGSRRTSGIALDWEDLMVGYSPGIRIALCVTCH